MQSHFSFESEEKKQIVKHHIPIYHNCTAWTKKTTNLPGTYHEPTLNTMETNHKGIETIQIPWKPRKPTKNNETTFKSHWNHPKTKNHLEIPWKPTKHHEITWKTIKTKNYENNLKKNIETNPKLPWKYLKNLGNHSKAMNKHEK